MQCPKNGEISEGITQGVNRDGTLKHTHEPYEQLIPLGHFNWKWNPARANYSTYQQELLSGILTLASQIRILGHLPIVWLCDQEATMTFPKSPPPNLPRLRRWWLILTQFRLNIFHIPGAKNELCDYLSRNNFCEKFQVDFEELAKQAFQKMDTHLDLRMEILNDMILDYPNDPKLGTIWSQLTPGKSKPIEKNMFWRNETKLFVEKNCAFHMKMYQNAFYGYIPHLDIQVPIGHFGISISFFFSYMAPKDLMKLVNDLVMPCKICCEAKPNTQRDRGLIGALPIPHLINDMIYVDFVQVNEFNGHDYVLTVVDGLSRFVRLFPCKKSITGEKAFKLIFEGWVQVYGTPREIISDNDVRFTPENGWWKTSLNALGVKVTFTQPRHPQSNGLCERTNRKFVQILRTMMLQQSSRDWIRLIPYVTWVLNNQINAQTNFSPHELFFAGQLLPRRYPPSQQLPLKSMNGLWNKLTYAKLHVKGLKN